MYFYVRKRKTRGISGNLKSLRKDSDGIWSFVKTFQNVFSIKKYIIFKFTFCGPDRTERVIFSDGQRRLVNYITFHDSRVGKLENESKSAKSGVDAAAARGGCATEAAAEGGKTCCRWMWWWSSRKADVSRVGKHPCPCRARLTLGRCGSGFNSTGAGTCKFPPGNLTPVTCCTICRKFAGSAVINVVVVFFDALDFRFAPAFPPPLTGIEIRRLADAGVSGSDPEPPPLNCVVIAIGISGGWLNKEEIAAAPPPSAAALLDSDFCRALVRVSVSRAKASEIHESANAGRNVHGSMLAKLSEDAIQILLYPLD